MFKNYLNRIFHVAVLAVFPVFTLLFFACSEETEGDPNYPGYIPNDLCSGADGCELDYCDQIFIPSGEFPMGADEESDFYPYDGWFGYSEGSQTPTHSVYLDGYCIDRYEVTYERYWACVQEGVCDPSGHTYPDPGTDDPLVEGTVDVNHYPDDCQDNPEERLERCPHHPVNCKAYEQAKTYCEWIGRRLCTEAEWERAANGPGPEQITFPWGEQELSSHYANAISGEYVKQVYRYKNGESTEGVLNLIGNIFEWVADYYAPYDLPADQTVANPEGPSEGDIRVCRGGCAFNFFGLSNVGRLAVDPTFDWG